MYNVHVQCTCICPLSWMVGRMKGVGRAPPTLNSLGCFYHHYGMYARKWLLPLCVLCGQNYKTHLLSLFFKLVFSGTFARIWWLLKFVISVSKYSYSLAGGGGGEPIRTIGESPWHSVLCDLPKRCEPSAIAFLRHCKTTDQQLSVAVSLVVRIRIVHLIKISANIFGSNLV